MDRYLGAVRNLQEIVSQMREAYQSQLSDQQNELMEALHRGHGGLPPLTLLTGWYGMNFTNIPELTWRYGYPACAIGASVLIVVLLLRHFRKKSVGCKTQKSPPHADKAKALRHGPSRMLPEGF